MLGQSRPTTPISARVRNTQPVELTLQPPRAPVVSHGPWLRAPPSGIPSEPDRLLALQTRPGGPAPWLLQWRGLHGVGRADRDVGCVRSSSYPRNGERSGSNASYDHRITRGCAGWVPRCYGLRRRSRILNCGGREACCSYWMR
jgi:hypothetical protein